MSAPARADRRRHHKDAREPLREAVDLARDCGAKLVAERAQSELTAAGGRSRATIRGGLDSLTASEQRIAAMAAGGRTNREIAESLFLTVKTVEGHLTHAYRKLGVSSRAQLSEAMSTNG